MDLISWLLQYTSLSLATGGLQFYRGRKGAEEAFPASSHSNKYFSAVQGFLSLLSLPTPAARKCSLQRSKLLSAHLDLQWSITLFALAKADKICKRKVMSFCHIQVQKIQGIHLVEMGENQSLCFFHNKPREDNDHTNIFFQLISIITNMPLQKSFSGF